MTAAPMREPVFTETRQIGIVVRDLEATMRRYVDDFGIGLWEYLRVQRRRSGGLSTSTPAGRAVLAPRRHDGRPRAVGADRAARRRERYGRFLAEKGEGVQHVAVATPKLAEIVAKADRENGVILSGKFGGGTVSYLGTGRDLGVVLKIFSGAQEDSE
jgi:hypothetical protein